MRVEDREGESQDEKERGEPAGDFREHVRRLCAENIFSHTATERCTQAFAFRPLHQDDQHHEQRDKNVEPEQDIDQKGHRDGQYRQVPHFVNGGLGGAVRMARRCRS